MDQSTGFCLLQLTFYVFTKELQNTAALKAENQRLTLGHRQVVKLHAKLLGHGVRVKLLVPRAGLLLKVVNLEDDRADAVSIGIHGKDADVDVLVDGQVGPFSVDEAEAEDAARHVPVGYGAKQERTAVDADLQVSIKRIRKQHHHHDSSTETESITFQVLS